MRRVCIFLILLLAGEVTIAQEQDTMVLALEEIIVMENRIRVPLDQKPSATIVLDSKTIEALPVSTISDLLHNVSGVDIRSRGVNGIQNDLSIRGSTFDQVLLMVNGIKVSDPQTGHNSMNLPIDISVIDRIEIYKGPSARVFGQDAFAGAINIITSVPERNTFTAGIAGGDFGLAEGRLSASFGNIDFRNNLSASYGRSDGYKYNTDYNIVNIFYQSEIFTPLGKLGFTAGLSNRNFGANGFYASPDYKDQFESITTSIASLAFVPKLNSMDVKLTSRFYIRNNRDEYLFIRSDPDYYRNLHSTNVSGFDINGVIENRLGATGAGIDLNRSAIMSNRLGDRERYGASIFLDHRFTLFHNRLSISPGIQASIFSSFDNSLLPGIDIGINLSEKIMVFINSGYTYHVPTYTDLFYEDPVNTGNSDLEPEYSLSNEIGFKLLKINGLKGQLGIFSRKSQNIIDRVKENPDDKWKPVNIANISYYGIELSTSLSFEQLFPAKNTIIKGLDLSYTYITTDISGVRPLYSRFEFENLRSQLSSSVYLQTSGGLYQTLSYRYYDRVNMNNYSILDTRAGWKSQHLNIYLNISNIVDTEYRETSLVTMPGRWFKIGIQYSMRNY